MEGPIRYVITQSSYPLEFKTKSLKKNKNKSKRNEKKARR